jgi:hypothetical protein
MPLPMGMVAGACVLLLVGASYSQAVMPVVAKTSRRRRQGWVGGGQGWGGGNQKQEDEQGQWR